MKIFGVILIIFAVLTIALASSIQIKDFSDPDHPGKCVINKDLILSPGNHPDPIDKCRSYKCEENGMGEVLVISPEECTATHTVTSTIRSTTESS